MSIIEKAVDKMMGKTAPVVPKRPAPAKPSRPPEQPTADQQAMPPQTAAEPSPVPPAGSASHGLVDERFAEVTMVFRRARQNTITSELFGHERGSFSGAVTKRTGMVEFADGAVLAQLGTQCFKDGKGNATRAAPPARSIAWKATATTRVR